METYIRIAGVGILGALAIYAGQTPPSKSPEIAPSLYETPSIGTIIARVPDARIRAILPDLIKCESGGDPKALNPIDLDGTPSHGLLQFKPGTLYGFAKEFDILPGIELAEIENVLYDPEIQVAVAEKMIEKYGHSQKFWEQQWPACSKMHGYWQGY